jgi:hypothetical protein
MKIYTHSLSSNFLCIWPRIYRLGGSQLTTGSAFLSAAFPDLGSLISYFSEEGSTSLFTKNLSSMCPYWEKVKLAGILWFSSRIWQQAHSEEKAKWMLWCPWVIFLMLSFFFKSWKSHFHPHSLLLQAHVPKLLLKAIRKRAVEKWIWYLWMIVIVMGSWLIPICFPPVKLTPLRGEVENQFAWGL